jgi:hypothetical protein
MFLLPALLLFSAGCGDNSGGTFDSKSGVLSEDYQIDADALTPNQVRLDSKLKNYYMYDHFVFLGQKDSLRHALTVTFARGMTDNRFRRAEADFTGFLFDDGVWTQIPYIRMKHDSTRLDISNPYPFGGLSWTNPHTEGEVYYERRDLEFRLKFSGLRPVQSFRDGQSRLRSHAIGEGILTLPTDTIAGTVYYELLQLEGYNPLANVENGISYTNYDWLALTSASGKRLLHSSDSTTPNDRIKKNFLALLQDDELKYADGSDKVRIVSDNIVRDPKTDEWLALKKSVAVPELNLDVQVTLTDSRLLHANGFCVSLVEGTLTVGGGAENVWGIVEHRQKPKSPVEALR